MASSSPVSGVPFDHRETADQRRVPLFIKVKRETETSCEERASRLVPSNSHRRRLNRTVDLEPQRVTVPNVESRRIVTFLGVDGVTYSVTGKRIGRPRVERVNTKCHACGRTKTPQWRFISPEELLLCPFPQPCNAGRTTSERMLVEPTSTTSGTSTTEMHSTDGGKRDAHSGTPPHTPFQTTTVARCSVDNLAIPHGTKIEKIDECMTPRGIATVAGHQWLPSPHPDNLSPKRLAHCNACWLRVQKEKRKILQQSSALQSASSPTATVKTWRPTSTQSRTIRHTLQQHHSVQPSGNQLRQNSQTTNDVGGGELTESDVSSCTCVHTPFIQSPGVTPPGPLLPEHSSLPSLLLSSRGMGPRTIGAGLSLPDDANGLRPPVCAVDAAPSCGLFDCLASDSWCTAVTSSTHYGGCVRGKPVVILNGSIVLPSFPPCSNVF